MPDVVIQDETEPVVTVFGVSPTGDDFVDAWIHGVLATYDLGVIVVTREVVDDIKRAAEAKHLAVVLA